MEVHHHPKVEKKNFKEYLLEGLMIFVAVTLGFFAETIRENTNEHSRAKEFAKSMAKDLKADVVQLTSYRDYFTNADNQFDTFMNLLALSEPKKIPSGKLYWYGLFGGANNYFVPNDATFQEMKSSGSLRFLDRNIEKEVAKYDRLCRSLQNIEQMNQGLYTELRKTRALFFDFRYLDAANNLYQQSKVLNNKASIDSFQHAEPPLLNTDKTLFNQYIELSRSRYIKRYNISSADSLLKQASIVITDLENKYGVEE